ncbi:MAG: TIGR01906 family membrane protein [Anaerolineaceae bacterium]
MTLLSRLSAVFFVLAIPAFLVSSNVRFFASETRFYERGFRQNNAAAITGVSLPELDRAADELARYFENDAPLLTTTVQIDGQEAPLYNDREIAHMKDVKTLMRFVYRLNEFSLAFIITYVSCVYLWTREKSFRTLAAQALAGVGVGFVALAFVGVFAITGFDAAWTKFHQLVFNNDLWRLDPSRDRLIQMFPEKFWQESTYIIGGLTLVEVALIVGSALAYLVTTRPSKPTNRHGAPLIRPVGDEPAAP